MTEEGYNLEIFDLRRRGAVQFMQQKTKALISCAVTAQLICAFVFAYAKKKKKKKKKSFLIMLRLGGYHRTKIFIKYSYFFLPCHCCSIKRLRQKMSRLVGKPTMWFPTRTDTNWPVQRQKQVGSLKFQI